MKFYIGIITQSRILLCAVIKCLLRPRPVIGFLVRGYGLKKPGQRLYFKNIHFNFYITHCTKLFGNILIVLQCSATCGLGQQEMQFSCVTKSHKSKDLVFDPAEAAAYVEAVEYEENFHHDSSAYGFKKPKTTSAKNHWKTFICGQKPHLSRSCTGTQCPMSHPIAECSDDSAHCSYPVLHRYCILPQFRQLCCHSCSSNNYYLP